MNLDHWRALLGLPPADQLARAFASCDAALERLELGPYPTDANPWPPYRGSDRFEAAYGAPAGSSTHEATAMATTGTTEARQSTQNSTCLAAPDAEETHP